MDIEEKVRELRMFIEKVARSHTEDKESALIILRKLATEANEIIITGR